MSSTQKTTVHLLKIMDELVKREPIFHRPEFGTKRSDFEKMTDEHFWEVGASGQRYDREEVLNILEERYKHPYEDIWEAKDFDCLELSPNIYLLRYILIQNHTRVSRRSTLWRRDKGGWKILYHQGTLVQNTSLCFEY